MENLPEGTRTMTLCAMSESTLDSQHEELPRSSPSAAAPWPYFAEDEIQAAMQVLRSGRVNYWTGNEGRLFEREFAEFSGCKYAVALANGTVALEAALRALGVGPGDDVITTARTFIASASCAVAVGARPVIADVDRNSQNITAKSIRAVLTQKTKAIVAVHLAGWPCQMDDILSLAQERDLKVVEDCAQAQGATYKGRPVGSMGDAATFSFCQDKIMTTGGEGGMLTTNDQNVWRRAWSYKDHGKDHDAVYVKKHPVGFRWVHESFGTNWRMTEIQSAIGRIALRKVPQWLETRRRFASILSEDLATVPGVRITLPPSEIQHAYYKYYLFISPEALREGWDRDRIMQAINAEGVPCSVGSCSEIYLEAAFARSWARKQRLPVAKELGETSLMFMVHPTLSEQNIRDTCLAVRKVMLEAGAPEAGATAATTTGSSRST
jgi:dTDP-4-amino-4,6-dideoxygalactose transaminase